MANTKYDPIMLTGKVYWASVVEPNTTYEPAWQVDMCIEDAETKANDGGHSTARYSSFANG